MTIRFRKTGDWKKFERAIDPRVFHATNKKHLRRAMGIIGKAGERVTRKTISGGKFAANAPLTVAIKGSGKKPLIDSSDMWNAVTSKVIDAFTVFVGVLRTARRYNVAVAVHEGAEVRVTERMRAMFWALWLKSTHRPGLQLSGRAAELWERFQGPWRRLTKNVIVTPARKFMKAAFENIELHKLAEKIWTQAEQATLRELAR